MRGRTFTERVVLRERFEDAARGLGLEFECATVAAPRRLRYRFQVDVPEYNEVRTVSIFWDEDSPEDPITHLSGPACRRHRNPDVFQSVCMWYPEDPSERRWTLDDGLSDLRFLVAEHAWCEARCSRGLGWPKPEAPAAHARPVDCRMCRGEGR